MADVLNGTLGFHTGSTYNERISINSAGNVGIGTSSPISKLDVDGGVLHVRNSNNTAIGKTYLYCDNLELGLDRTADGLTQIDFWASSSTINWDAKIIRNSGANGTFELWNKGTGDMVFNVNSNPKMYIKNSGNVGIGLTNPTHKLDVAGKVFSNNGFFTPTYTSSGNYYFGTEYSNYILAGMEIEHTTLTGNYSQKVHFRTHHFAISHGRRMTIDENGNVGIDTTNPNYKLDLGISYGNTNQASAKKLALYNNAGNNFYGFGISGGLLNFYADVAATAEPQMVLSTNGFLGIGTTNPNYPLTIGSASSSKELKTYGTIIGGYSNNPAFDCITNSFGYGMYIGGWSGGGTYLNGNSVIETSSNLHIDSPTNGPNGNGHVFTNWYNSGSNTYIRNRIDVSDRRIKTDIIKIDNIEQYHETFEIIKKIGAYKYKYKDIYRENNLDQYGFIAQEVKEYYPVASKNIGKDSYLPDIMKEVNFSYEINDNEYTFTIEYDLDMNQKYLFYAFKEDDLFDYIENIKPLSNNTFIYKRTKIKGQTLPDYYKLVVVGTYTDDKLGVNKDKLFQLSFSGIIGLINENEILKNRIDILEENQKNIIQKLNEISNPI